MPKPTEKATSSDRNHDDREQQTNLATYIQLVGFAAVLAGVLLIAREHAKHH